ncbi:zinc ribbon domain-containing protein [Paenibacillus sp. FSL K6-2524]|uniref:zinc ribbon domain-containing protein n=1 Tax=Paenibacillus sp. FSL K6-2524 TaxID=2954516 RepID=UPI0030F92122
MNCPRCHSLNDDTAKFCNSCGSSLSLHSGGVEEINASIPKKEKKGGCLKSLLIVIGALFVIFLLIGIFAGDDESTQQATSQSNGERKITEPTENPFNLEDFKLEAEQYPYKELARNPKEYLDKKLVFVGQVVQVMESGNKAQYRINVTSNEFGYEDTIYVFYKRDKDESRILEDDIVTIWGESKGLITYEATIGGNITIPQVDAVAIELMK